MTTNIIHLNNTNNKTNTENFEDIINIANKMNNTANIINPKFEQSQLIYNKVANSPRLPKTAFVLFLEHTKESYFNLHPDATFYDFQVELLSTWKNLNITEKSVSHSICLFFLLIFTIICNNSEFIC